MVALKWHTYIPGTTVRRTIRRKEKNTQQKEKEHVGTKMFQLEKGGSIN